jgi:hypothetical protein
MDQKKDDRDQVDLMSELVRETDIGLMLGNEHSQTLLNEIMAVLIEQKEMLRRRSDELMSEREKAAKKPRVESERQRERQRERSRLPSIPPSLSPSLSSLLIDCSDEALDLLDFYDKYFSKQVPVVIRHAVDHWPAMQRESGRAWNDLDYLLRGKACARLLKHFR